MVFNKLLKALNASSLFVFSLGLATVLCACGDLLAGTDEQGNTLDVVAGDIPESSSSIAVAPSNGISSSSAIAGSTEVGMSSAAADIAVTPHDSLNGGTEMGKFLYNVTASGQLYTGSGESAGGPDVGADPETSSGANSNLNISAEDTNGRITLLREPDYLSISCVDLNKNEYTYSERAGSTIVKRLITSSEEDVTEFAANCSAEGGTAETLSKSRIQCVIDNQGSQSYNDPYWERFSTIIIDHCRK